MKIPIKLFVLFVFFNLSVFNLAAQELPPKYSVEEALDKICTKWTGTRIQNSNLTSSKCIEVSAQILKNIAELYLGVKPFLGKEISGEFSFDEIKAMRKSENTDCSNAIYYKNDYFKSLPFVMTCKDSNFGNTVIDYFGNSFF